MVGLALILSAWLPVGPAAASNGEEDGRVKPPDRSEFEGGQPGPNRETPKAKERAPAPVGDRGVLGQHMDQDRINAGAVSFDELFKNGARLFQAKFNKFDGQGRPLHTTGNPPLRARVNENYIRTSGPDSSSCWQCHNLPRSGGAGDFNGLMFTGLHAKNPFETNTVTTLTNQRSGPSIFGAGAVEMLAREMSAELAAIRAAAKAEATAPPGKTVTRDLVAKGVSFGKITVHADGKVDPSEIDGVDWDLIIKPFTHKGNGTSLRGFPTGGGNLHMGMQSVERFGAGDPDGDGVAGEFSIGDVTSMTVWMAGLPIPGRVIPKDKNRKAAIERGEALFTQVGCASCHTPAMYLNNPFFTEPGPFNGTGLLKVTDVPQPFAFDLTETGPSPRPERTDDGRAIVRVFSDFKRHNITDRSGKMSDEQFPGGAIRGTAPASNFTIAAPSLAVDVFLTERLWDVGNTGPWGHRSDQSTLTEAIEAHGFGGDAKDSRVAYEALPQADKDCVIDFLNSLQIVPENSPRVTTVGDDVR